MAGAADAAARLAVAQQCDSLLSRPNISTFDESLGAADYARWRRDLLDMAASIHIAFKATLLTQQNFPLALFITMQTFFWTQQQGFLFRRPRRCVR